MSSKSVKHIKGENVFHTWATTEESMGFFPEPIQIMRADDTIKIKTRKTT